MTRKWKVETDRASAIAYAQFQFGTAYAVSLARESRGQIRLYIGPFASGGIMPDLKGSGRYGFATKREAEACAAGLRAVAAYQRGRLRKPLSHIAINVREA